MGLRRGISQQRSLIRAVSLFIILGTIPFYIGLMGIWLFSPQSNRPDDGPTFTPINGSDATDSEDVFSTFTPINADEISTQSNSQPVFFTLTPNQSGTYTYYTPDTSGLASPTPPPTRYLSPTPQPTLAFTNTVQPSNTPAVAPTDVIVPTQPPLIPPTDTPTA